MINNYNYKLIFTYFFYPYKTECGCSFVQTSSRSTFLIAATTAFKLGQPGQKTGAPTTLSSFCKVSKQFLYKTNAMLKDIKSLTMRESKTVKQQP